MQPHVSLVAELSNVNVEGGPYTKEHLGKLLSAFYGNARAEQKELGFLRRLLVDCDRFIDVGAHVGQHTYNASLAMTRGELLAIEANPFLIPVLNALGSHIERVGNRGNKVRVFNAAITNQNGPVKFFVSSNFATASSLVRRGVAGMDTEVTVSGVGLDSFYRESRKTVVKVDVEGAEYRVLLSADKFLSSDHTMFFVELHGWGDEVMGKYPLHVCGFFRRKGYALRHVGRRRSNHYVFYRAGFVERTVRYLAVLPRFGFMAAVYHYAKPAVPVLRRIRDWPKG